MVQALIGKLLLVIDQGIIGKKFRINLGVEMKKKTPFSDIFEDV